MPTYDYECDACGELLEIFQQITERPKRKCPNCGAMKLRRLIGSGAAVIFRGSGFYQTDYRSKEYKKKAKADSQTDSKSSSSDAGKSKEKGSDAGKSDG